jgi:hypothetical protein
LSAEFLGAVTLLQWACLHADSPYLSMATVLPRLSHLPINLTLVKEEQVSASLEKPGDGYMRPRAAERSDWGPLVTHCYGMYWQCLASFLKWVTRREDGSAASPSGGTQNAGVVIGCADVAEMARCCLDNLDAAALSVGVVIESVATVLPKVPQYKRGMWASMIGDSTMVWCPGSAFI